MPYVTLITKRDEEALGIRAVTKAGSHSDACKTKHTRDA
jgi:hypothetical protein